MSSPVDRSHQSKLFNFVNRQYLKWRERSAVAWRRTKVTLTWTTQILLYPIYLIAQTGRLIERQFTSRINPQKLFTPTISSESESPLEATLESATTCISNDKTSVNLKSLACDRQTQKLLLVQEDNSLLDTLTLEQQQHISKAIVSNLAIHRRYQREKQELQLVKEYPNYLPPIQANNHNIFPPIRYFWQVMAWIQNSAVAREVNLFGEASLLAVNNYQVWEYNHFNQDNLIQIIIAAFHHFWAKQQLKLLSPTTGIVSGKNQFGLDDNRDLEMNSLKALIWAAITYFSQQKPTEYLKINGSDDFSEWLSWDELYTPVISSASQEITVFIDASNCSSIDSSNLTQSRKNIDISLEKPATDYLETEVTEIAYVEHPLSKILNWLDKMMFRLEKLCIKLWNLVKGRKSK